MNLRSVFYVLFMISCTAAPATSQTVREATSPAQPCPDERTYTGKYRNLVFGFSIIIPAGLKGYWNSARCAPDENYGCVCLNDHGRFIPLSVQSSIEAFVGWQMETEWTLRDYEKDEIANLKQKQGVKQVRVLSSRSIRLGSVKARRFIVRFNEDNKDLVAERIVALYDGVEYELILHTVPHRYRKDRREFDKLVGSWKLTRRV
jgi:hypothetical protein